MIPLPPSPSGEEKGSISPQAVPIFICTDVHLAGGTAALTHPHAGLVPPGASPTWGLAAQTWKMLFKKMLYLK